MWVLRWLGASGPTNRAEATTLEGPARFRLATFCTLSCVKRDEMWKRKRSVDQLYGKDLVDRAHKLDIRFTNISEDCIKSQIRDAERVLRLLDQPIRSGEP